MSRQPEIRIGYGFQLEPIFKKLFEVGKKKEEETFPTFKEFWARYGRLPAAWRVAERPVLEAMSSALDLEFRQDVIDVHLAYAHHSLSNPMIVGVRYSNGERFIEQMTHELARRLLNDNTRRVPTGKILKEMFPEADMSNATRAAILPFALQELVLRDVLAAPEKVERLVESAKRYPDHAASWEIVLERGYKDLIEDFRSRCAAAEVVEEREVAVEAVAA